MTFLLNFATKLLPIKKRKNTKYKKYALFFEKKILPLHYPHNITEKAVFYIYKKSGTTSAIPLHSGIFFLDLDVFHVACI